MININILFENNETTVGNIVIIDCFIGLGSVECMALLWKLPVYYLRVTWKGWCGMLYLHRQSGLEHFLLHD